MKELVEKLSADSLFKDWQKEHSENFLSHFFVPSQMVGGLLSKVFAKYEHSFAPSFLHMRGQCSASMRQHMSYSWACMC